MAVLTTRLFKPENNAHFLRRKRLIDLLEQNSNKPLTLVVAAAGYGKSVAVSQWLDEHKSAHCWISLDGDCNELRLFLEYLAASIGTVYPDEFRTFTDLLGSINMPPNDQIVKMILNELNTLPGNLRIVLDDYHLIKSRVIHDFMNEMLHAIPVNTRFIIISRYDPPIKLGTMKAYERMFELRMADLRFSEEEISIYASTNHNEPLTETKIKSISQITEGWILGIRLMIKEIHSGRNVLESLKYLQQEKNQLSLFLMDEIFAKLSDSLQMGLMLASLFDRFNLDMIERATVPVAMEQENYNVQIRDQIEEYIHISMFIIPLDKNEKWFRFHHLIQNYLQSKMKKTLSQEKINEIYLMGSDYFASTGDLEEAIKYALEGNNLSRAVEIIAKNHDELLLRDQYGRLEHWIGMIPAGASKNYPDLLLIHSTLCDSKADYEGWKEDLDCLEAKLEPMDITSFNSKKQWGEYYALKAGLYYYTGKIDKVIEKADKALDLLAGVKSYYYDYALAFKAFALQILNKGNEAVKLFKEYQAIIPTDYRLGLMRSHSLIPLIYIYQADINAIKIPAKLAYQISKDEKAWLSHVMASYFLGNVHYFQNDLNKVDTYVQSASDHQRGGRPLWAAHTLFLGVLNHLALRQHEKMKKANDEVTSFLKSFKLENFDDMANSMEVELAIRQNDLRRAEKFAIKTTFESVPIIFSFYFSQLTRVKLLLLKGDDQSMRIAFDLLMQYEAYGNTTNNINFLIQLYALLALWYQQKAKTDLALENLRKSLEMARPGLYIRTYLDLGADMYTLFDKLSDREKADEYITRIIYDFGQEIDIEKRIGIKAMQSEGPLSHKEMEILKLVSQGYQNKEIADQLCLSSETVKKYLYYAYNKLGVKNRTSAVSKAISLNLIESLSGQA